MKITYCGPFRFPIYDAAAARVLNNARVLTTLGHSVEILSWGGHYRDIDKCPDGIYRVDGIKYTITDELEVEGSLFAKVKCLLARGNKTIKILKDSGTKQDLIIVYDPNRSFTNKVLKFCKEKGIFCCSDITEWYDNNELYFFQIIPNWINMTRTQRQVKNKILISSYLGKHFGESNNIIIPPLCNAKDEKWNLNIDDHRINQFDGITLIYAGTPAKKDCLHTVINVVNRIANEGLPLRILILGCERETYIMEYSSLLTTKELHPNICFLGRVSQDLIPAYYKYADFMILLREPTRKSMAGFPTKFAESYTAGIPVITNNTSDLKEYIIDGETGFIVPGYDENDIYEFITRKILLLSHDEIRRMKQYVLGACPFDYTKYTSHFEKFLKKLK